MNFPWHLRMDFELNRYSGKMTLPFDLDIEVFKKFLAAPGEFVDIVSMECEIDPVSYDRLRVTSTKEPITLQSNLFADMKDVRGRRRRARLLPRRKRIGIGGQSSAA